MDEKNVPYQAGSTSVIQPQNSGTIQNRVQDTNNVQSITTAPISPIVSSYESLDGPDATITSSTNQTTSSVSANTQAVTSAQLKPKPQSVAFRDKDTRKLLTRLIAGGLVVMLLLFGGGMISSRFSNNRVVDPVTELQEQEIASLSDNSETLGIQTSNSTLLVNGNVLAVGNLQMSDGTAIGTVVLAEGSESQTYTLPNTSGVFCLDSNNCGYLQADDVTTTSIAGVDGALSLGAGLAMSGSEVSSTITQTSVNNSTGSIIIQGTTNQVGVSKSGNVITLTSPQDIGLTSSPTFSSITLSGIGTQNGNVLCDISNNCGYAGGTSSYIQDGNSFGEAALLGTNDNFSLAFETNGITQATLAVGGAFTLQNSTDSTSAFRVMDADGGNPVLNVDTTNERVGIGTASPSVELDVVGDTVISDRLQIGPTGDNIDQCTTVFFGVIGCDVAIDVANTSTDPNTAVYGMYSNTTINSTGTHIGTNYGSASNLFLSGTNNYTSSNIGVSGAAIATNTAGTVSRIIGVDATAAILTTASTATVTEAIGMQTGVGIFSTVSGGTITTGYGLQVSAASVSGTGASIGTSYGIYVNPQTSGTNDYGVAIGAADTQTLWLSSNADNTSASAGIAFGSSRDTNLYRSAANTLRTDDALSVGDDITVTGDVLPSADDTYDLGSNSNRWRDLYLGPATLSIGTSTTDYKLSYDTGGNALLFNNDQEDRDFRIAGDTQANLLYVDAGNNRIGIGTNTPGYELDVVGTINASTSLYVGGTQVCTTGGCTAASGSGNYIQNGTALQTANFNIQSAGAASIGTVVRGAASQTAALQEWQSNAGTVLARITASGWMQFDSSKGITGTAGDGYLYIGDSARAGAAGGKNLYYGSAYYGGYAHEFFGGSATNMTGVMLVTSSQASKIGLTVKGAASQTGDLQQWQNSSGTRLTSIESTGSLYSPTAPIKLGYDVALQGEYSSGGGFVDLIKRGSGNSVYVGNTTSDTYVQGGSYAFMTTNGGNGIRLYSYDVTKAGSIGYLGTSSSFWNALWLQPTGGSAVAATFRAHSAQSANLVEWQDSAGTVKTAIAADGDIVSTEQISIGSLTPITGVRLSVHTYTDVKGLVVRGSGSQTANLQEWQSSAGTALASVSATGAGSFVSLTQSGNSVCDISNNCSYAASSGSTSYIQNSTTIQTNTNFAIQSAAAGSVGAVIRGASGQTANLQEWQNNSGTALRLVSNTGDQWSLYDTLIGGGTSTSVWNRLNFYNGSTGDAQLTMHSSNWYFSTNGRLRVSGSTVLGVGSNPATIGTVEKLRVNNPTTVDNAAAAILSTGATTSKGLVVQGVASQTANLQQWQSSAGTVLTAVDASGNLLFDSGKGISTTAADGNLYIGQSSRAGGTGGKNLYYGSAYYGGYAHEFFGGSASNMTGVMLVTSSQASKIGLTVKGAASQTANLQEWQSSAGTVLASVSSGGNISVATTNGSVNVGTSQAGYISIGTQSDYSATFSNQAAMCINTVCLGGNGSGVLSVVNQTGAVNTGAVYANTLGTNNIASRSNGVTVMQIGEYVGNTKSHVGFNIASASTAAALFSTSGTTTTNLAVRAITSQTANLQEWQNSSSTALASVNASGQLTATGLVSTQTGTANDLYFNRSDTNAVRIKSNWGGSTAYGVQIQPSAGSVTSYASGYGVVIGNAYSSSVTSGNYDILRVYDNAFNPSSGSSQLNGININPIINQTGTASGISRGVYINPTLTSAVDFRGIEIANASGYGLYQSGASVINYLNGVTKIGSNGTAGTVEKLRVNTPTTVDNLAATILSTGATTSKGLVVQGAASQTANLQEWQSSTGTALLSVGSTGLIGSNATGLEHDFGSSVGARVGSYLRLGSGGGGASSGAIRLFNSTFVNWRNAANSANIGIGVNANDTLQLGAAATTLDTVADAAIGTSGTTRKGLVIQGVASQSANLQEWQDSTGALLASIAADGDLEVVDATVNGNLVVDGTATFGGNITVNGKIITGNTSGSTTVAVDTAGAGAGASASISGNDTSGVITINTGTGAAAGRLATITFSSAFPSSPNVVITPKAIPGGGAYPQYHYDSATGTFDLSSFNALTDSSTYTFSYFITD